METQLENPELISQSTLLQLTTKQQTETDMALTALGLPPVITEVLPNML